MENIDIHTVENFYGVYLLYCTNPKYLGRTYIGYTVNPNRRIKQHNKGCKAGGARRTSNRGPWDMVLIVHGFPNDIAALRFEWAWQHPHSSRRLNHVTKKKAREKVFNFCLRVLTEMLSVGPWNRLPLVIRWLKQEYVEDFLIYKIPPLHMPLCYGPVISKKIQKGSENNANFLEEIVEMCSICVQPLDNRKLICINTECYLVSHIICLSKYFMKVGEYVPIEGRCPKCDMNYLWGDVIRKFNGCYNNLDIKIDNNNGNDFYCSDSE